MKKILISLAILWLLTSVSTAAAYSATDNDISDWGLDDLYDTANWGTNSSWIPNSGIYTVEDNNVYDYNHCSNGEWYAQGVHIKYPGATFNDEPCVDGWIQPAGGEQNDVEGMWVDQDADNIYVLIITSVPPEGFVMDDRHLDPADLGLDLDYDGTYEWAVETTGANQWTLYDMTPDNSWNSGTDLQGNDPVYINHDNAVATGTVVGQYVNLTDPSSGADVQDHGFNNYILEIQISKTDVGMSSGESVFSGGSAFHFNDATCGNDATDTEIPEFPLILIPAGLVIGSFFYFQRKKN